MFQSVEELDIRLRAACYVLKPANVAAIYGALTGDLALLVEGPPGTGKTELARALTAAANTHMERLHCYEGIGEEQALGRFDRPLQDHFLRLNAPQFERKDWPRLREAIYTLEFFSSGPLVRSLLYEKPCVLLIDEIDKTSPAFELMLQHAATMGANAVIGMRYNANEVTDGVTEVLAYGTAVVVERE